jgi:hypothetical protein
MDTSNSDRRSVLTPLKIALLVSGVLAVYWSATTMPRFWQMIPANDAVERIVADEKFKSGVLADVMNRLHEPFVLAFPQPRRLRAKALIQLRLAEERSIRESEAEADASVLAALTDVRSSLAAMPADPFLWLMLYSVETVRSGFDSTLVRYLNQSYASGPHEGWISLRRNRLALGVFQMLSAETRTAVISEFNEIVDADFIDVAALNLTSAGWPFREQLISALSSASVTARLSFYRRLRADGTNLHIPGIKYDERPW